jgi:hypothetical protein
MEKRKKLISIWEREVMKLIAKFSKKKTEDAHKKEAKLIAITAEQKEATLQEYLHR